MVKVALRPLRCAPTLAGLEPLSTAAASNVNRRAAFARPPQTIAGNRQVDIRVPGSSASGADRLDMPSRGLAPHRPKGTGGTVAFGPAEADVDGSTLHRPAVGSVGRPGPDERFGGASLGFSLRIQVEQSRLNVCIPMIVGDKTVGGFEFTERLPRSGPPDPIRRPEQEPEVGQSSLHPGRILDSQEIECYPMLAAVASLRSRGCLSSLDRCTRRDRARRPGIAQIPPPIDRTLVRSDDKERGSCRYQHSRPDPCPDESPRPRMSGFSSFGALSVDTVKLTENPAKVFREFTRQEGWRNCRPVSRRLVIRRQPQCDDPAVLLHVRDPLDIRSHGIGRAGPRTGSNAGGSRVAAASCFERLQRFRRSEPAVSPIEDTPGMPPPDTAGKAEEGGVDSIEAIGDTVSEVTNRWNGPGLARRDSGGTGAITESATE